MPIFLGVHDYDVARWLANSEPVRVYAESQSGVLQAQGYAVEDSNWAMITFQNGILAVCETGWILPHGHPNGFDGQLAVQGDQGRMDMQLLQQGLLLTTDQHTIYPDTSFMPEVYGAMQGGFVTEVQHFLDCIRDNQTPRVTSHDGLVAVQIAEAVRASARTHQPVHL